jgi:EAL domain-containing protein (putative c-di-GMP-specific phosphodiesterase class I)
MTYLARLPIDIVKIDKSFIRDIDSDDNNLETLVKAIINMSSSLNMENVFEGVETRGELSVIRQMGGDIIQGYLYSKPLPERDIFHWIRQNSKECQPEGENPEVKPTGSVFPFPNK